MLEDTQALVLIPAPKRYSPLVGVAIGPLLPGRAPCTPEILPWCRNLVFWVLAGV